MKKLVTIFIVCCAAHAVAQDADIRDADVSAWPCLNSPSGTAKTQDGIERNAMKNRAPVALAGKTVEPLDTAAFLKKIAAYDNQLRAQRRAELSEPNKKLLEGFQNQLVSLTGYLVIAYPGPPETCNCGDRKFHDWHLEIFENSADHAPREGDPTPIICEITPRTEQLVYRSGIRLRSLAGFFREGKENVSTGHPPQLVKVTGYLMWDDEHNGTADIGTNVQYFTPGNGFHHPWRSTAWEIHPLISIEAVSATTPKSTVPPTSQSPSVQPRATAAAPQVVTITRPVPVKIPPYGETVIPRGMKLEVISRDARNVRVKYLGQVYDIPIDATDLK